MILIFLSLACLAQKLDAYDEFVRELQKTSFANLEDPHKLTSPDQFMVRVYSTVQMLKWSHALARKNPNETGYGTLISYHQPVVQSKTTLKRLKEETEKSSGTRKENFLRLLQDIEALPKPPSQYWGWSMTSTTKPLRLGPTQKLGEWEMTVDREGFILRPPDPDAQSFDIPHALVDALSGLWSEQKKVTLAQPKAAEIKDDEIRGVIQLAGAAAKLPEAEFSKLEKMVAGYHWVALVRLARLAHQEGLYAGEGDLAATCVAQEDKVIRGIQDRLKTSGSHVKALEEVARKGLEGRERWLWIYVFDQVSVLLVKPLTLECAGEKATQTHLKARIVGFDRESRVLRFKLPEESDLKIPLLSLSRVSIPESR